MNPAAVISERKLGSCHHRLEKLGVSIVAPEVFLVLYPPTAAAVVVGRRHRRVLLTAAAAAVVDPRVAQSTDPTRSSTVFLSVQKTWFLSVHKLYFSHVLHFVHMAKMSTWHLTAQNLGPRCLSLLRDENETANVFRSKNIKCEKYVSDIGHCLGHPLFPSEQQMWVAWNTLNPLLTRIPLHIHYIHSLHFAQEGICVFNQTELNLDTT